MQLLAWNNTEAAENCYAGRSSSIHTVEKVSSLAEPKCFVKSEIIN